MPQMWTKEDYLAAQEAIQAGMTQLRPDGYCCVICGDSGHQAWECHRNPLVKMARSEKADSEWRCFICGEVFTDEVSAHHHFGRDAVFPPTCRCDDLTALLRWAETEKHKAIGNRPDENIYKRVLTSTWNLVIDKIIEIRASAP